ncbi:MAG: hypothetical protein WCE90_12455 [Candidatus Zixiibacteriota bacterium]
MKCKHINSKGKQCSANAMHGSLFCFFHDPDKRMEQQTARVKGGKQGKRAVLENAENIRITRMGDVIRLLNQTINQVRKGELDHKVANSIAYLSNVLVKTFEGEELQERMEKLEQQVDNVSKEGWR